MNENLELKDVLFYSDLIYEIRRLAGFEQEKNKETETRIAERHKGIVEEKENGKILSLEISAFQQELFEKVIGITTKAGVIFRGLEQISKYPELVNDVLTRLEKKQSENIMISHLKLMISDMGLEHGFSLGESAEQRVCLNRNGEMWEVYLVERGNAFEKTSYEECYDACIKVLEYLSDSKQIFEKNKDEFSQVKKLSLKK